MCLKMRNVALDDIKLNAKPFSVSCLKQINLFLWGLKCCKQKKMQH